jgi:hypothetical protein
MPIAIAEQLALRNIETITVRDLGLLGDEDVNHLQRATEMGYVLCTFDPDYIQLATEGVEHAGIVFGHPQKHWIGAWVEGLTLMHTVYLPNEMLNRVEYL